MKQRYKNEPVTYTGNYATWEEAKADSTGYDAKIILEKVKQSVLKVKNGEVAYERDSMTSDNIQYFFPLIGALTHVAIEKTMN